jgi:hypothetical protein
MDLSVIADSIPRRTAGAVQVSSPGVVQMASSCIYYRFGSFITVLGHFTACFG